MVVNVRQLKGLDLLLLLLLTDLVFIGIHVSYIKGFTSNSLFSIEIDGSYAEVFQYTKEAWITMLVFAAGLRAKHAVYFAWSLLFFYLLLDDSLQIHEVLGAEVAALLHLPAMLNLRAVDFGELIISLTFGGSILSLIGVFYLHCDPTAKFISQHLFFLLTCVALFGVAGDMAHSIIPWHKGVSGMVEDGGEMFIFSVIVCYAFNLKRAKEIYPVQPPVSRIQTVPVAEPERPTAAVKHKI